MHINLIANLAFVLISAVLQFICLKVISSNFGVELFGIWVFVIAILSITKVFEAAVNLTAVKFVSESITLKRQDEMTIYSSMLMIVFMAIVPVSTISLIFSFYMVNFSQSEFSSEILQSLPFATLVMIMISITSGNYALMDALGKSLQKLLPTIISQCGFLLIVFTFDLFTIKTLSIAYLLQAFIAFFISSLALLFVHDNNFRFAQISLIISNFFNQMRFSFRVQIGNFFMAFYDPVTRSALMAIGGPAAVAIYEVINQIIVKLKQLLNTIHTVMLANFKRFKAKHFTQYFKLNAITVTLGFSTSLLFTGVVINFIDSSYPINHFGIIILNITWWVNSLALCHFYHNISVSNISVNNASHALIGLVNLILVLVAYSYSVHMIYLANLISVFLGTLVLFIFSSNADYKKAFLGKNFFFSLLAFSACILIWNLQLGIFISGFFIFFLITTFIIIIFKSTSYTNFLRGIFE
tara:strand:- start:12674 stop:14077 length:1404 start_codon:yes stop_codon:yes gene_type:complete